MKSKSITQALILLVMLSAAPAWAGDKAQAASAGEQGVPVGAVGCDQGEAAADGEAAPTGLNIVMDGTSLEAWNQCMELVKETGDDKEYLRLQDAFDYLLMFDIGAKNDPATLAKRLNGLTGNQIVKRVKYGRGKGKTAE